ncbi:RadC family protein [Parabacteroides pacaensis]|uniref:RadC family protein n=1 Tax=Parabacteroides pacaensis TaxID=2086575 RepID=UPI000D0FD379|nr:DNA repair protein RadC [Parabacteroides pacaensis]
MEKLSIKNWAKEDRPREKMLLRGAASLSNAELLAILISSGNSKETAVELATRILYKANNNLSILGKYSISDLINGFTGIGTAKAVTIVAALELGKRRGQTEVPQREILNCSNKAYLYFYPLLCDLPHEELWIVLLSRKNKVIEKIKVSQGGISETAADIRIILKAAICALAPNLIVCHNHPSGNTHPSLQDDKFTHKLYESCQLMDINLADHIILCDGNYYSYADEAKLN